MINPYFWAKKKEDKGQLCWLPLCVHLEDTKNVSCALWTSWLSQGQRNFIISSLSKKSEEEALKLVGLLGAIHDIGKATPAFQLEEGYANSKDLDLRLLENLESAGFRGISKVILAMPKASPHALAGEALLHKYGLGEDVSSIIGAHHGKPSDSSLAYKTQISSYESNYYQYDDEKHIEIQNRWEEEQKNILDWALDLNGYDGIEDIPKISQPGQVILSGLLIMADWIASNEKYFPLISIDEIEIKNKRERRNSGWEKWCKTKTWQVQNEKFSDEDFKNRFGFCPRKAQKLFVETIDKCKDPGIFIFEAPMGLGKTEAALFGAEELGQKRGAGGLFFGLPTQATSNGIFPRILGWLNSIEKDFDGNLSLRLVHGKASLNEDFISLMKNSESASLVNIDESSYEKESSIIVNEWFSGRKTTNLDDFVVGTIDQLLLLSLKQKHLALRHLGFSKKVVIIDEVHSYDSYMNVYLYESLKWLGAYNVPVIILSATLPAEKRVKMAEVYLEGKGQSFASEDLKDLKDLHQDTYPLITYTDGNVIKQEINFQKDDNERKVKVKIIKENKENLINILEGFLENDGVVGIILNTVKSSQELAKLCSKKFGEDIVELLHSSFIATDRINKEEKLLNMIGKGAKRPKKKIIIGTQVIEQSLDIDFDILITELAPMDLMLQRMGRLHRHDILRPSQFENPICYILGTNENLEFDKGSVSVYGEYLLARSQYFLKNYINMPEDISTLVQKVYNEVDIDLNDDFKEKYYRIKSEYFNLLEKKEDKANKFRIKNPILKERRSNKASLIAWLKNDGPQISEVKAYAKVRDTTNTIEVIALKKYGEGYGTFSINKDLTEEIEIDKVAKEVSRETIKLPSYLCLPKIIDDTINYLERFNLKYLSNWQKSKWLKGELGIIFDKNNEFKINDMILKYSKKYGLTYEKERSE